MTTPLAAFGIYSGRRPAVAPLVGSFPYSSFTAYQGLIAHGPYLFDITAYESSDQTAREMSDLAQRASARVEPTEVSDDLTLRPPFNWLPPDGRHPGTEKLARGPVSLRATLGGDAKGTFWAAIEATHLLLAKEEIQDAERAVAEGGSVKAGKDAAPVPYWVVAGYHPRTGAGTNLEPRTRVVLLINHGQYALAGGTARLRDAAARAIAAAEGIWESDSAPEKALCWSDPDGAHGCLIPIETHLAFVTSRLEREAFGSWIAGVTP